MIRFSSIKIKNNSCNHVFKYTNLKLEASGDHCPKFIYMTFITIDEHLIVDMVLDGGHCGSQVTEEIVWVEPF